MSHAASTTVSGRAPGATPSAPERFCAAIVLFHPEGDRYLENVATILDAGLAPIVFDNSDDEHVRRRIAEQLSARFGGAVTLLSENGNIGLSAAYNRIIGCAERTGRYEAVVLLDQDSTVPGSSLRNLVATYLRVRAAQRIGVLSGMAMRPDSVPYRVYRLNGQGIDSLIHVRMAPSSFSLIPLETIRRIGGFHDDFFIDHIDVDFCFRCHHLGLMVAMDPSAPFPHQIGLGLVTVLGYPVSPVSSPFRHYYQVRNILLSARRRGASWSAALWEVGKRFAVIGVVGLSAGQFFTRYRFALAGLRDGVRNRGGRMP